MLYSGSRSKTGWITLKILWNKVCVTVTLMADSLYNGHLLAHQATFRLSQTDSKRDLRGFFAKKKYWIRKTKTILDKSILHIIYSFFNLFVFLPRTPLSFFLKNLSSVMKQKGESQNGCFKKTKHAEFSEQTNIFYPLIRTRMCVYQRVTNVRIFWKILRTLFSWKIRFENSPFCLITDTVFNRNLKPIASAYSFTAFTNNDRLCAIVKQFMKLATIDEVKCGQ